MDNVPQIGKAFLWVFKMVDLTDGYTGETGKSVTVQASKDGAGFGGLTGSPAVSEIGGGYYKVTVPATDMVNTVALEATASGCRPTVRILEPAGDSAAVLAGKRVVDVAAKTVSYKQPDGVTEQLKLTYSKVGDTTFAWTPG